MEKYNIVFIETEWARAEILGRRAEDFVLREFSSFGASVARMVKKSAYKEECVLLPDCVNVVLELDMPLVKLKDVTSLADRMKRDKINCVRLGSKDALSKICIGKDTSGGVFSSSQAFLRLMMQNRSIWCIIGLKTKYLTKCFRAE